MGEKAAAPADKPVAAAPAVPVAPKPPAALAVPVAPKPAVAVAAAAAPKPASGAVEPSAEMKAFLGMLDGKDGSAGKALKKFGATKAVQTDDLGMYTLTSPKLTKSEKVGDLQCYTMESSAGVMKHTSQLCWDAKGKIAKVTDKSE